jgi:hypothetical protein
MLLNKESKHRKKQTSILPTVDQVWEQDDNHIMSGGDFELGLTQGSFTSKNLAPALLNIVNLEYIFPCFAEIKMKLQVERSQRNW